MSEVKRAVVYARVSTEDQAKHGYSLQSQVEEGRKYADDHGWSVVASIIDDGVSGAKLDRPGLNRIFEMAEAREFEVLIVYDIDRLARKVAYQQLIEIDLEKEGVKVRYVRGDFADTQEGRLQKTMLAAIAEYERAKISERHRRGALTKARNGKVVGAGRPTFGYTYRNDEYLIDESQARVVRMIYDWYVEGVSIRGIARKLQNKGIKTRNGNDHWSSSSIHYILKNETYVGTLYYNRRERQPDSSLEFRDEEEWIEIPVPAIVDQDVWNAAQARRERNLKRLRRRPKHKYLLSGMLRCETCDRAYSGGKIRKNLYYRDGTRKHKSLRAEVAESAVWNAIHKILTDEGNLAKGWKERQSLSQQERKQIEAKIERHNSIKKNALRKIDKLTDAFIDPDIPMLRDEYIRRREDIQAEIDDVEDQVTELEGELESEGVIEEQIENYERFRAEVSDHLEDPSWEMKRKLLQRLQITGWVSWTEEDEAKIRLEGLIPTSGDGLSFKTGMGDGELQEAAGLEDAVCLGEHRFGLRDIHKAHKARGEVEGDLGKRQRHRTRNAVLDAGPRRRSSL
jgi:site-specific DNA recombinase